MTKKDRKRFEAIMLPHIDAAYNLARWLVRNAQDADDIVQMAYARAFEAFSGYADGNSAAWILTIVRNTAYSWLRKQNRTSNLVSFDEVAHSRQGDELVSPHPGMLVPTPEDFASQLSDKAILMNAIENLALEFREVVLLREMEGFSYKEISEITRTPVGTVMSRLSRGRQHMQNYLLNQSKRGKAGGL